MADDQGTKNGDDDGDGGIVMSRSLLEGIFRVYHLCVCAWMRATVCACI